MNWCPAALPPDDLVWLRKRCATRRSLVFLSQLICMFSGHISLHSFSPASVFTKTLAGRMLLCVSVCSPCSSFSSSGADIWSACPPRPPSFFIPPPSLIPSSSHLSHDYTFASLTYDDVTTFWQQTLPIPSNIPCRLSEKRAHLSLCLLLLPFGPVFFLRS